MPDDGRARKKNGPKTRSLTTVTVVTIACRSIDGALALLARRVG
jgi:hypothetical protein